MLPFPPHDALDEVLVAAPVDQELREADSELTTGEPTTGADSAAVSTASAAQPDAEGQEAQEACGPAAAAAATSLPSRAAKELPPSAEDAACARLRLSSRGGGAGPAGLTPTTPSPIGLGCTTATASSSSPVRGAARAPFASADFSDMGKMRDDEDGEGISDAETEADLQELKARTMYRMVEDITLASGSKHKVLFVTNKQARLLASTPGSIKRVLEAFEIPTPKLVIRFLQSSGSCAWVQTRQRTNVTVALPWEKDMEDALLAEERLYNFMEEVLVPLAVDTNALILVHATGGSCLLTEALSKVMQIHRSRFGIHRRFSVLAMTCDMKQVYAYEEPTAAWHQFRKASPTWRRRHRTLLSKFFGATGTVGSYDLNGSFDHYLLCDGVNELEREIDHTAFGSLTSALTQHLMEHLPCIAFKTGISNMVEGDEASLGAVLTSLESGSPTILVNPRKWPSDVRLEGVKEVYEELEETLHAAGCKWDYNDSMATSLFYIAMQNSQEDRGPTAEAEIRVQVEDLMHWFSEKYTKGFDTYKKFADEKAKMTQAYARALQMSRIIRHHHLRVAHCSDLSGCKEEIQKVVIRDRLPKTEDAQGVALLADAWSEFDAKFYLSDRYKLISKRTYAGVLLLTILAVALSVLLADAATLAGVEVDPSAPTFITTLLAASIASFSALLKPTERWRVLRSSACTLQSITWHYRTRTKMFGMSSNHEKPQKVLCERIRAWKKSVVAEGSSLLFSTMEKAYPDSIFRHAPPNKLDPKGDSDDFYSPVKPSRYVDFRLVPQIAFYQAKIPTVGKRQGQLRIAFLFCSFTSAALSFFGLSTWVALSASIYSSLTAWQEFSGLDLKLRRYTEAVQSLKSIKTWWTSLTEVEQASPDRINLLVNSVEEVICHEVGIWAASLAKLEDNKAFANAQEDEPGMRNAGAGA